MTQRRFIVCLSIAALVFTGAALSTAEASETPDIKTILTRVQEGGYVVLAEKDGKMHRIANEADFKAITSDPDSVTFFLEETDSGKRHKVARVGSDGKSRNWGKAIWNFFCCLGGTNSCCNK